MSSHALVMQLCRKLRAATAYLDLWVQARPVVAVTDTLRIPIRSAAAATIAHLV